MTRLFRWRTKTAVDVRNLLDQAATLDTDDQLRIAYNILGRVHPAALTAVREVAAREVDAAAALAPQSIDEVYLNLLDAAEPAVDASNPIEVAAAQRHIAELRANTDGWRVDVGIPRRRERATRLEAWTSPIRVHLAAQHQLPEVLEYPEEWDDERMRAEHRDLHADAHDHGVEHGIEDLRTSAETTLAAAAAVAAYRNAHGRGTHPEPSLIRADDEHLAGEAPCCSTSPGPGPDLPPVPDGCTCGTRNQARRDHEVSCPYASHCGCTMRTPCEDHGGPAAESGPDGEMAPVLPPVTAEPGLPFRPDEVLTPEQRDVLHADLARMAKTRRLEQPDPGFPRCPTCASPDPLKHPAGPTYCPDEFHDVEVRRGPPLRGRWTSSDVWPGEPDPTGGA